MSQARIVNLIGSNFHYDDIPELFNEGDVVESLGDITNMAHLLVKYGVFKSVREASNNGWRKPIPNGWSEFSIGKTNKRVLFIWNPKTAREE
jgi:hypothetical protein